MSQRAFCLRLLQGLTLFLVLTYGIGLFTRFYDADEFQTMTLAVKMAEGKQAYTEIWDNHGPFVNYYMALVARLFPWESHFVMLVGRLALFPFFLGLLVLVYHIAHQCRLSSPFFPWLSLWLLMLPWFFAKPVIEIRADNPANFLWALCLLLWLIGWNRERDRWFFLSGLALGLAFFCSLKTLLLGVAAGGMFFCGMALQRRWHLRRWFLFGLGCGIGFFMLLGTMTVLGNGGAFWESYVGQNMDREKGSALEAFDRFYGWDKGAALCLVFGLFYGLWAAWRKRLPQRMVFLLAAAWILFLLFLFLLPTHYMQSLLTFLVPASLVLAWSLLDLLQWIPWRKLFPWQEQLPGFIAALLLIGFSVGYPLDQRQWWYPYGHHRLAWADSLLKIIPEGQEVMDGYGLPFYRPKGWPYHAWVGTLRRRLEAGNLDFDLVQTLQERNVVWYIEDERVDRLPEHVTAFVEGNTLELCYPYLRAAGRILSPSEKNKKLDISLAGLYHWKMEGALGESRLWVDGGEAENPVHLTAGPHRLRWAGETRLFLCILPPEDWSVNAYPGVSEAKKHFKEYEWES